MSRSLRLKAIRELISNNKITSQENLIKELKKRGFEVTQATVSRDIQYLNVIKVRDASKNEFYAFSNNYFSDPKYGLNKLKIKFKESVISVQIANNIIVIKTNPGEAQGVAAVVDGSNFKEILGTVAGDDTIICVAENNESAQKITELFKTF